MPVIGRIADTHAHLDMLDDPSAALANAARAGVSFIVTVVDPTEDAERTFDQLPVWQAAAAALLGEAEAAQRHTLPEVRVIVGAHPHNAKDLGYEARGRLAALAENPLTVGIGEIGLDYHYDHSPREIQRVVFAEQLEIARQLRLPAVVHLREAHDDGLTIMRDVGIPAEGCVLHCFTGDAALLGPFLELGCHVSFAGPVTFKKADAIRQAASVVPADRLLVETDCPFMTPEPFRGRPNEPAFAVLTAKRMAEVRGIAEGELARITHENAQSLFGGARVG